MRQKGSLSPSTVLLSWWFPKITVGVYSNGWAQQFEVFLWGIKVLDINEGQGTITTQSQIVCCCKKCCSTLLSSKAAFPVLHDSRFTSSQNRFWGLFGWNLTAAFDHNECQRRWHSLVSCVTGVGIRAISQNRHHFLRALCSQSWCVKKVDFLVREAGRNKSSNRKGVDEFMKLLSFSHGKRALAIPAYTTKESASLPNTYKTIYYMLRIGDCTSAS
jgi:hypothetical protein